MKGGTEGWEGRKGGMGRREGGTEGGREVKRREYKNTTVKGICAFTIVFSHVL